LEGNGRNAIENPGALEVDLGAVSTIRKENEKEKASTRNAAREKATREGRPVFSRTRDDKQGVALPGEAGFQER